MTYISTGNPASRGSVGNYWSHSFEIWIGIDTANGNVAYHGNDRVDIFTKNPDGSYTAPDGIYARLEKNPDGTYLLTDRYGDKQHFDTQGKLTRDESHKGTYIDFEYANQTLPYFVTKVTDNWGRALAFGYLNGLMNSITELYTNPNRTWIIGFDAKGNPNLITIPGGNTVGISYLADGPNNQHTLANADSLIENVTDSIGVAFLTNSYNQVVGTPYMGSVIQQSLGGKIYQFAYIIDPAGNYTLVTDPNNNQRRYYFNDRGFMTEFRQYTNRDVRPTDPEFYRTVLAGNKNFEVVSTTFPLLNSVENTFDINNEEPLARGNLLEVKRIFGANELVNS
jgi:YD repeat-containing protein